MHSPGWLHTGLNVVLHAYSPSTEPVQARLGNGNSESLEHMTMLKGLTIDQRKDFASITRLDAMFIYDLG